MLRVVVYALAILHLGPGIAFAVLAFGCGEWPLLGAICQKSELQAIAILTVGLWLAMSVGLLLRLRASRDA